MKNWLASAPSSSSLRPDTYTEVSPEPSLTVPTTTKRWRNVRATGRPSR